MKLKILAVGVAAVAIIALSSCSSPTASAPEPRPNNAATPSGVPSVEVTSSKRAIDMEADRTFFVEDATSGYLVIGGSGSCAPEVKEASFEDSVFTVKLDPEAYADKMCTFDYKLYSFDVKLDSGDLTAAPITARVIDGENETELSVNVES
jgi:hypothetical protein